MYVQRMSGWRLCQSSGFSPRLLSSFAVSSQAPVEVEDELVTSEGSDLSLDSSDSESEEETAPSPPPAKKSKGSIPLITTGRVV